MTAQASPESFMPILGSPKYRKKSCTSRGVKPWHAIIARQAAQQPYAQRQRDTQAANAQRQPCRLHIQGRKALHKRPIHSSTPFG